MCVIIHAHPRLRESSVFTMAACFAILALGGDDHRDEVGEDDGDYHDTFSLLDR
jgi:hypothetical protein